jgi:hypothetical protein
MHDEKYKLVENLRCVHYHYKDIFGILDIIYYIHTIVLIKCLYKISASPSKLKVIIKILFHENSVSNVPYQYIFIKFFCKSAYI